MIELPVRRGGEGHMVAGAPANRGGIIHFEAEYGILFRTGTRIARIVNPFGDEAEATRMPSDGYVMTYPPLSWVGNQAVVTGDYVADICA